jgi:DNA mismatch repair ATPase MutL
MEKTIAGGENARKLIKSSVSTLLSLEDRDKKKGRKKEGKGSKGSGQADKNKQKSKNKGKGDNSSKAKRKSDNSSKDNSSKKKTGSESKKPKTDYGPASKKKAKKPKPKATTSLPVIQDDADSGDESEVDCLMVTGDPYDGVVPFKTGCFYCGNSSHAKSPETCSKAKTMPFKQKWIRCRLRANAMKNGLCFSCFSDTHKLDECDRVGCTNKKPDGSVCNGRHNKSLCQYWK